jgi:hypothetical protein
MYILGNADQLAASSEMWCTIINELEDENAIGPGIPIACKRHQEIKFIREPGVLNSVSPDGECNNVLGLTAGGCMRPCDAMLVECGHRCTRKVRAGFRMCVLTAVPR